VHGEVIVWTNTPTPTDTSTFTPTNTSTSTHPPTPTPTNVVSVAFVYCEPWEGPAPLNVQLCGFGFDGDDQLVGYKWLTADLSVLATGEIASSSTAQTLQQLYNTPTPTCTCTPTYTHTPTPGLIQLSDINGDGVVDYLDVMLLMDCWRQAVQ
jgi:hypothetical protein